MQKNTVSTNNADARNQLSGFYCNQNTTAARETIKCEQQHASSVVLRQSFMETSCATKQAQCLQPKSSCHGLAILLHNPSASMGTFASVCHVWDDQTTGR